MGLTKKQWAYIFLVIVLMFISYKIFYVPVYLKTVKVTSVSSDGLYAITSNIDNRLILWDLKQHKAKIISSNANIYSAYFIKNTNKFIWQDLQEDKVYIQDVNGNIIDTFKPGFKSYGHVMTTDLQTYIAGDLAWNLYGCTKENCTIIKKAPPDDYFVEKLLKLILVNKDNYLLTIDLNYDPQLMNVTTDKFLARYRGTETQRIATASPDNNYVVGGDARAIAFVWDLPTGKMLFELDDTYHGRLTDKKQGDKRIWSKEGLIPQPEEFGRSIYDGQNGGITDAVQALKFIDKEYYLRFANETPWAILYHITNPQPIKYFYLGKGPFPSVNDYEDSSIDSSHSAHVLVTGQYRNDGIIVYQYDPKNQTLDRVWEPSAPSFLAKWFWVSK